MEKISYKINEFEGPLDLLLHLISKNKLDIHDIQISLILDQYLEHIGLMAEMDMDVSSEFLEMAARLVYIKTVSLLPKHEEADDLKKELTGQLIEYQECKRVAAMLFERISFDLFSRKEEQIEFDTDYALQHDVKDLLKAYVVAVGRKNIKPVNVTKDSFSGILEAKMVSVTTKVVFVLRKLWSGNEVLYKEIFDGNDCRSADIATFLAILELTKSKRIILIGEGDTLRLKLMGKGARKRHGQKENK